MSLPMLESHFLNSLILLLLRFLLYFFEIPFSFAKLTIEVVIYDFWKVAFEDLDKAFRQRGTEVISTVTTITTTQVTFYFLLLHLLIVMILLLIVFFFTQNDTIYCLLRQGKWRIYGPESNPTKRRFCLSKMCFLI